MCVSKMDIYLNTYMRHYKWKELLLNEKSQSIRKLKLTSRGVKLRLFLKTMIPGELGDMIKQQRGGVECFNRDI